MNPIGLNEIREKFLLFFESKNHLRMKSFPLVPQNDKSLLLINSGMAPLKPYFTGQETPPSKRATTCQKCIRTGDIENVGITARHGTFFEMLGSFSFGDYFKEVSIPWAWEFLTKVMEIPEERLFASVFYEDDEAYDIWHTKMGLPKEKIFRMGKEDNFWEVGLGPCGPCSEIYYDRGEKYGCNNPNCTVGCDCDRYVEVWNLVFTQFNKNEDGSYSNLEHPNIDTGMGLERIACVMQDVSSIFDVDTIMAIRDKVCEIANVKYGENSKTDVSVRIITDHIRSVTFMTADGVLPSNEGRGYVLRRLLRRATRHAKLLGIEKMILTDVCNVVIETSKDAYPELLEKRDYIFKVLSVEEKRFFDTLNQGMEIIEELVKNIQQTPNKQMSGEEAFKLYDTYGFPIELLKEILELESIGLDEVAFNVEMEKQRERARSAREQSTFMGTEGTVYDELDTNLCSEFCGYNDLSVDNLNIVGLIIGSEIVSEVNKGDEVSIILNKTPFYAESGGQAGDEGVLKTETAEVVIKNCIKVTGNKIAHIGNVAKGSITLQDKVVAIVNQSTRMDTARNHTATHLLQKSLREVLGNHVEQAGSQVSKDRLRFDFTHFQGLTQEDLRKVEDIVNDKIMAAMEIEITEETQESARKKGAMALFGEKYGDKVRVINMGNYSIELCGGTHLKNTSEVGSFKIISENGVSAGVRRIEALTGKGALNFYRQQESLIQDISSALKVSSENITKRINQNIEQVKQLKLELEKSKSSSAKNVVEDILNTVVDIKGVKFISSVVKKMEINELRELGDKIKDKLQSGVIVLASKDSENVTIIVMATDDVVKKGIHAGNIIKECIALVDGRGGGKPNMAQAGGKNSSKIDVAIQKTKEIVELQISTY